MTRLLSMSTVRACLAVAALLLILPACKKDATPASSDEAKQPAAAKPAAEPPKPTKPTTPPPPQVEPPEFAGAHILIAYKGAMRANPKVTRTKEQAQKLATELTAKAKKAPGDFAKLAAKHSDGPSAKRGGSLGSWRKGRMVPAFDQAIEKLKIGEISNEPVETPFGYHVMQRQALPEKRAGAHILIAYKGAMRANPKVTRSKKEAAALAKKLATQAKSDATKFGELAKANSDGPSGPQGGKLGVWRKGRMVPAFDEAIDGMKVGEVSEPVETPFGYHVIKREDPAEAGKK